MKLKKRLFDPEFQIVENRYKQIADDLKAYLSNRLEIFEGKVNLELN